MGKARSPLAPKTAAANGVSAPQIVALDDTLISTVADAAPSRTTAYVAAAPEDRQAPEPLPRMINECAHRELPPMLIDIAGKPCTRSRQKSRAKRAFSPMIAEG